MMQVGGWKPLMILWLLRKPGDRENNYIEYPEVVLGGSPHLVVSDPHLNCKPHLVDLLTMVANY